MKLQKQYLQLAEHFGRQEIVFTTLDELSNVWGCTHRNASQLIGRMSELTWLEWSASRGRGHRSRLRLLVRPEKMAEQIVLNTVTRKDILDAFAQIRAHSEATEVRSRLEGWMLSYFGFHREVKKSKKIDVLRLPIRQSLSTLDPLAMNMLAESFVASHVYDTLLRKENGQWLPHLAHAWETDESRTRWTFYLRKGVYFHDGQELDSGDAVFSLERLMRTERRLLYRFALQHIHRIHAVDRHTLQIELKQRNEWLLPFLSTSRAAILPADTAMTGITGFERPIGSGPFKITEWNEQLCVLEVFPQYFRERALLDRVEIYMLPEALAASDQERTDPALFQVIHNPRSLRESEEEWRQVKSDITVSKFITFNTKKPGPLADSRNRRKLCALLASGERAANNSHAMEDPLVIVTIPPYERDARAIAKSWEAHGIPVELHLVSPEQFKGDIRMRSDVLFFSLIRDQDEPLRLHDLFLSMAEHLEAHVATDIESLLKRVQKETDPESRARQLKQFEKRLMAEHRLAVWEERPVQTALHRSVRGVAFHSQGWVDLRQLWFG